MAWLNSQHVTLKAVGTRKLLPKWLGPFKILAKPSPVNYVLDTPAHYRIHTTFHVSMLRRACDNGAGVQRPPIIMIEGGEEFEIQEILNHTPARKTRTDTGTRYLVQWRGYGPAYNSWEPERTLKRNAAETLSDYWDELEAAVQAAEPQNGSDTGLAPSDQVRRGRGRGRGRGRTGRGRGRGLRPVSKSLKK